MKNTSIKPKFLQLRPHSRRFYYRSLWVLGALLLFSTYVVGQDAGKEPVPLTVDDYKKAMTFKLKNLDEDTYVKLENNYVLDRENKPYVFTYSDGVERRIYMYKMMKGANRDEVATLALYSTPKSGKVINVVIPNAKAEKKVWDLYIDDLKLQDEKEKGFLSTLAFVLSREYAMRAGGAGAVAAGAKSSGDYDFCFPAEALVTMADRTHKKIDEISAGEKVMAFDLATQTTLATTVTAVQSHFRAEGYGLTTLTLLPLEEITASAGSSVVSAPVEISATANHPVLTSTGRKPLGEVQEGELLFQYDGVLHQLRAYRVVQVQAAAATPRVYNLETAAGNYLINGTVVLDK